MLDKLRETAMKALEEVGVEAILGFRETRAPLVSTPFVARTPNDISALTVDYFCGVNIATYLHRWKGKKVAVVARGCEVRAIVALCVEKQLSRDEIYIIGVPCKGAIDRSLVDAHLGGERIENAHVKGDKLCVDVEDGVVEIPLEDVLSPTCRWCAYPTPPVYDVLVGEPIEGKGGYPDVEEFEKLSCDERWERFSSEIERCIRCYACRQACPMCYCEECFVDSTNPEWVEPGLSISDLAVWHIMRAYHQAGRCVDCGACERACPMGIKLVYLTRKLNKDTEALYGFTAGISLEENPPLANYRLDDAEEFIM